MYVNLLMQNIPAGVECVSADNSPAVSRALRDFQPDIIHRHGMTPGEVSSKARLVVSPHGEAVGTNGAYVVIARSPYELASIAAEHKELVRNPLITKTISFAEAAADIAAVYRRVMDSNPAELLNADTRHLLAVLLKAGLSGDKRWVDAVGNGQTFDFRHLLIYASLEGVLPIVLRGFDVLGVAPPQTPVVDCYLPKGYSKPEAMPGATVTELLHDINSHGINLLRLAELTKALHSDNLDEDELMRQTEEKKQLPLLQSALQVLSEQTLLTEGFMPCRPADNALTQRLRSELAGRLKI